MKVMSLQKCFQVLQYLNSFMLLSKQINFNVLIFKMFDFLNTIKKKKNNNPFKKISKFYFFL